MGVELVHQLNISTLNGPTLLPAPNSTESHPINQELSDWTRHIHAIYTFLIITSSVQNAMGLLCIQNIGKFLVQMSPYWKSQIIKFKWAKFYILFLFLNLHNITCKLMRMLWKWKCKQVENTKTKKWGGIFFLHRDAGKGEECPLQNFKRN